MDSSNRNGLREINTLVDLLNWRSQSQPNQSPYTFLVDGEKTTVALSNRDLAQQAQALAAKLQALNAVGERVLLLMPPGLDYIAAFFGCLYAGAIAVPIYPPRRNRSLSRLQAIVRDASPRIVLTTTDLLTHLQPKSGIELGVETLLWIAVDAINADLARQWQPPVIGANSLAFLQYTSGSTANPKGVMVTHHNLLHNLGLIRERFAVTPQSCIVSWLPPYHDMGLIGGILQPLYAGAQVVLMTPVAFLQRPIRWLQAITQFQADISGGPNFAYALCAQRITAEERASLDLSHWQLAFNGAEPVRAETLTRFAEAFAPCGFQSSAFYPCYGMAEATLLVTGGHRAAPPVYQTIQSDALAQHQVTIAQDHDAGGQTLVGCGQVAPSQTVAVVDPDTQLRCLPHQVGEIWVAGASVAQGYWRQPEATTATFQAHFADSYDGPFLRTGDLGFLAGNELFITGRLKDLIIIRGRNHYPQDLEQTAEQAHPALRAGGGAAFAMEIGGEHRLVIVHEVERRIVRGLDDSAVEEIVHAVRKAITEHHDLQAYAVYLVKPGGIPKTSSGKIQRRACQQGITHQTLAVLGRWCDTTGLPLRQQPQPTDPAIKSAPDLSALVHEIQTWLVNRIAEHLNVTSTQIDPQLLFSDYGIDSATAVSLSGELEQWLKRRLSPTLIYDYPTITHLAQHLAQGASAGAAVNTPGMPSASPSDAIAIVGMGCRFPGADSPEAFWDLLASGREAITKASNDRWDLEGAESRPHWGGFLTAIDQFDAHFFGIAPREAEKIDPQQRWLLEVAWEALEQAGQSPTQLAGSQTGVFVGISSNDYSRRLVADLTQLDAYVGTGNALSIAANRLSYLLNLRGPSLAVDTACSSSLVAVHLACQSLRQGECDLALVGGVNALLSPELTLAFSQAQMMAADGRCKTFDAAADGYVRGEGCGVVVLKCLSKAEANGDRILAVIRGSAINQDGRSNGLTAPNGPSQQAVVRQALANANVAPSQVQYVETHGTGTPLGDPIEVDALKAVLAAGRSPEAPCYLGSVKTNLGHLESAAGIAGLIKGVLALQHQEIPPHLNLSQLNPYISLDQTPFAIATETQRWATDNPFHLAGVSSFGFGGTNAHVILEAADSTPLSTSHPQPNHERPWQVLTLSGKTESARQDLAQRYQTYLSQESKTSLADICFTANTGRTHLPYRLAIATNSKIHLQQQLTQFLEHQPSSAVMSCPEQSTSLPKIAFVFTGQGAQYVQMGRQLYETYPEFRQTLDRCDEILRDELGDSLLAVLYPPSGGESDRIDQTRYTQPALFALEYALAELWQSWGIKPDVVMGHSIGEYVAACVAGVFDLETGLKLIAARARLMQALPAGGQMAVVFAKASQVAAAIAPYSKTVALAAINGPESVVISGAGQAVKSLLQQFEAQGLRTRPLTVSHAFHSPLMAPMLAEFERVAEQMTFAAPQIPLITNTTGQLWQADMIPDVQHWLHHISAPVQFQAGMDTLKQQGCRGLIEIGPTPTLLGLGQYCWPTDEDCLWLPSLKPGQADWQSLLASLATLYVQGLAIDWVKLEQGYEHRRIALPTYPFQRQSYWLQSKPTPIQRTVSATVHPLLGQQLVSALKAVQFEAHLSPDAPPFLDHHRVFDAVVLPATAYLEMALAAGAIALKSTSLILEEVAIQSALILSGTSVTQKVQTIVTPESAGTAGFEILSLAASDNCHEVGAEQLWTSHAKGKVQVGETLNPSVDMTVDLAQLQAQCSEAVDVPSYYQALQAQELDYGDDFQSISQLWRSQGQALGQIRLPASLNSQSTQFHIHPVLLDACFQIVGAALTTDEKTITYLPTLIKRFSLMRQPGESLWCHVQVRKQSKTRGVRVDLKIWDVEGQAVACIDQLHLMPVTRERLLGNSQTGLPQTDWPQADWQDWLYQINWQRQARDGGAQLAAQLRSPAAIGNRLATQINALFAKPNVVAYVEGLVQLEGLSAAYVVQAFQQLGWLCPMGQKLTTTAIAAQLSIGSRHHRLLPRLLAMLAEEGWLKRNGEHWQVVRTPVASSPQQHHQKLLAQYPDAIAELTLLERCGSQLAAVLQGRCDPLQLLFPEGDLSLLTQLYQDSPGARVMNTVIQQVVTCILGQIHPEQSVRILEIGAGTGGTTAGLLQILPEHQTDYRFTDVSPLFVARAKTRFADYPFVRYDTLDIEQDPINQGFEPHQYHIVVAANVLHATADLRQTLNHVKQLLVPGGSLVFLEGTTQVRWLDLIFGLTEGWWRFTDTPLRTNHPLLPTQAWQTLLEEVGFTSSSVLPTPSELATAQVQQTVMVAQAPPALVQASDLGGWLIFADDQGLAQPLATELQAIGARCLQVRPSGSYSQTDPDQFTVNPTCLDDFRQLLQAIQPDCLPLQGIIHLWSLDTQVAPNLSAVDLAIAVEQSCGSVLHLVQALSQTQMQVAPLWLVTQGAVGVAGEALPGLAQAPLWGLGRTLALEQPELRGFRVDLAPSDSLQTKIRLLYGEIVSNRLEDQVAFREQCRYVARLARYVPAHATVNNLPWQLTMAKRGTLADLQMQPVERKAPQRGEVEIRVRATGLNFLDVLDALGLLPFERGWFGAECAGEIVAVGSGVQRFAVGDAVIAIAPGSFSQYVTITPDLVAAKPAGLSFAAAATIPINFLTAYYALRQVANLSRGDRILIHAAAGGTGMAAVQLAQQVGAEVFATASPDKWEALRALGVTHIMNSRTVAFAEDVMLLTQGQGVDCVFNSLAGEFIPKSLSVLNETGCFLEIGKNNVWSAEQVHQLKPNVNYAVVDLFQRCHRDPAAVQMMLQTLLDQFQTGTLKPLPLTIFPIEAVTEAFRYMQQAKHVGKVVITQSRETPSPQSVEIQPEGTYLITGGLGGLGLLLAQWLVEQGAQQLMLLSRQSPSSAVQAQLTALEAAGATVIVAQADVTQAHQLAQALAQAPSPLRGVIHTAGVLADGTLQQIPWQRFSTVLAPKVVGAWNLHQLTREQPLDFFVLFSSAAALFGSPGQANHAAANAFLDALAHDRQTQGLSGLSLNWGVWTEIGAAAQKQATTQMALKGIGAITPQAGAQTFAPLFSQRGMSQIGVVPLNWPQLLEQWPTTPFFADFISQRMPQQVPQAEFLQQLQALPKTAWRSRLTHYLRQEIATILGFSSVDDVDLRQGFFDLGMDSLTAVELKNRLQSSFGCSLSTTLIFDYPTGESVVDYLAQTVLGLNSSEVASLPSAIEPPAAPPAQDGLVDQVKTLSETEIADLLQQELVAIEQGRQG